MMATAELPIDPADDFRARLAAQGMAPLWDVMAALVTPEPRSMCVPAHWRRDDYRPLVEESGAAISAERAERRVLVLENPAIPGKSQATASLYAGIQYLLPGEIAPAHSHSATALRFILDGDGAYTTVDGERIVMAPGDFVVTPAHGRHDHGNHSAAPMMWLDILDVPIVNLFETSFSERSDGAAPYDRTRETSAWSYETIRPRLAEAPLDPAHGRRLRYTDASTGDWATATMGATLSLLPAGFTGSTYRSTDGTIFCCGEGSGTTEIEGAAPIAWAKGDVFVIPSWQAYRHRSAEGGILFAASDRPAQEKLGLWREARG
jgi:gentisate 1,2-dioxygenase